ncbi:MAG TPA: glycosyltransferase family 4 protein [Pseudolysinimonas sp.]|nr:glycosyltransferase family 4 protein [Pseudolysinimonas sp.]
MSARRVLVLESQTPFVHGGAEMLARELVGALQRHGCEAELVSLPFRDTPREELLAHAAAWRLLDLTRALDRPVDVVIATKFPTYFARHPAKVAWLVHQHRAAYELCGTPFSDFDHTEGDVGLRKRLIELDTQMLQECRGLFSIARTVSARLEKYNGLTATSLYHPPRLAASIRSGSYGDYLLTVSRLEKVKRIDLAIDAFARVPGPTRLIVAGDGSERAALAARIEALGLSDRVRLAGRVPDAELIELLAGARALLFAPFEEDYGYVTLEAFLAKKPVITTSDAGGPLEFVEHDVNGYVTAPDAEALAAAVTRLAANASEAARLGDAGFARARLITWDGVVERLLAAAREGAPSAR